jgi:hypothetical protein
LTLLLSRYGIPEALVSDGVKAYTGRVFKRKAREAAICCKLINPFSPWQKRAEGEITEVKLLEGLWMVRTRSPCPLWDHCIELSYLVRAHTAHDLYKLQGQVPETVMMGHTADISCICEFPLYSLEFFNESRVQFSKDTVVLGRYIGPTEPEVGSVLTEKLLKNNGEVVRRNTFSHLRQDEYESEESKKARSDFD